MRNRPKTFEGPAPEWITITFLLAAMAAVFDDTSMKSPQAFGRPEHENEIQLFQERAVKGGCAYGKVRYQLLAQPIRVHCCHCTDCQRHTGSAFVLNAIIETSAIKVLRGKGSVEAIQVPRTYGPHDIHRCSKCKTAL